MSLERATIEQKKKLGNVTKNFSCKKITKFYNVLVAKLILNVGRILVAKLIEECRENFLTTCLEFFDPNESNTITMTM